MSAFGDVVGVAQADWGWIMLGIFALFQIYWPFWQTKLQTAAFNFNTRLENIEITQVAIAQEVTGVSEERVSALHDQDEVEPSDLKERPPSPPTERGRPN